MEARGLGLVLAASLMLGMSGTSSASSCSVANVTLDGANAAACGWGDIAVTGPSGNDFTSGDPSTWSVNLNNIDDTGNSINGAGSINTWALFEKEEEDKLPPAGNDHDGNTSTIGLVVDQDILGGVTSGTFSLNASSPLLITLKGGTEVYHWYLFENKTGALSGAFNTVDLDGADISTLSAYTVVPVPAAVWLFGSGLLGLVGVARRKRA